MRLKKFMKYCRELNSTKYELWVMDEHHINEYDKKYNRYKVYEMFTKTESPKTIYIAIYKRNIFKKKRRMKNYV